MDSEEFFTKFLKLTNGTQLLGEPYASTAYDSIWAASLVLNKTLQDMQNKGI